MSAAAKVSATRDMAALVRSYEVQGHATLDLSAEPGVLELCDRVIAETASFHEGGSKNRITETWIQSPAVREMIGLPPIIEFLRKAYGGEPFPCHTLNFLRGSQQKAHTDLLHNTPVPHHRLANAWFALEDVLPDAGPVFFYPGSHKLPLLTMEDLGARADEAKKAAYDNYEARLQETVEAHGFERKLAIIKKGQVFFWAANMVHGGSPAADPSLTRRSMVAHYYFRGDRYSSAFQFRGGRLQAQVPTDCRTGRLVWSVRSIPSPLNLYRAVKAARRRQVKGYGV